MKAALAGKQRPSLPLLVSENQKQPVSGGRSDGEKTVNKSKTTVNALPKRFTYQLQQTTPGRICLLTRDCESLARALGEPYHSYGTVSSNVEIDPVTLALEVAPEPGVKLSRLDNWKNAVLCREDLAEIYPGTSDEKLREMGFDIDTADRIKAELAKGGEA